MSSPPQAASQRSAANRLESAAPSVLVFDVNETLIDIDSIAPLFKRIFGDPRYCANGSVDSSLTP